MTRALIFPGQGSQAVGMGQEMARAFPVARHVFEEVDETLQQSLTRLMFEGPEDDLQLTQNAQPALMAVSIAAVRVIEQEGGVVLSDIATHVAGHSLGEYGALVAAGTFSISDAARLLRLRGLAMQEAVPVGEGAMAALMGMELEEVNTLCAEAINLEVGVCDIANDNAPGQVVVSGSRATVEKAAEIATEAEGRGKRSVMLPVSAPFHCSLMQPAAERMAEALGETTLAPPTLPLVANVSAETVRDPEAIRDGLVRQVTGRVRWRESVLHLMAQEVDTLVEIGAGRVLTGLARRIDRALETATIGTPADLDDFISAL